MRWHDYNTSYVLFQHSKPEPTLFSPEFIGAFFGAFFAFVFGLISYHVIKRYERFVKHRDSLVILERLLNEHIDTIGLNRSNALNTQRILERHQLTHNRLIELPLRKELDNDLGSLSVINRYFSYERFVQRINVDSQSMNYTLTRFEDVMIGGGVLQAENWHYITGAFAQMPGMMDKIEKETKELLSLVRIHIASLSGKGIWYANTRKSWDIKVPEEDLKREIASLEDEIKVSAKQ